MQKGRRDSKIAPIVITNAQDALSIEQRGRQRRYFISMMVRTGCFIATIFLPNPYRWFAMGAAIVLPYVAVVIANAGRESGIESDSIIRSKRLSITDL